MRVLGISGSLRRDSHNTALLLAAARADAARSELVLYEGLKAIPPYDTTTSTSLPRRSPRCARRSPRDAS